MDLKTHFMEDSSIYPQNLDHANWEAEDHRDLFPGERIVVLPRPVVAAARQHFLLKQWLVTDIGYFPQAATHFHQRLQGCEQAIFIFCVKGSGWCEMAGTRNLIQAGDVLVLPPHLPHSYGSDGAQPWTIYWFHAVGSNVDWFLRELGISPQHPRLVESVIPRQLDLFEEALQVLESGYAHRNLLCSTQILQHLVSTLFWRRSRADRAQNKLSQNTPEVAISRTVAYMEQHLEQKLSIAVLASLANLSPSHFSVLFRRYAGYAPMDYFTRLRMHQACQLLDTTELSVQQIAARVGYPDSLYFSRLFKSINGLPPSQYRKQHKG